MWKHLRKCSISERLIVFTFHFIVRPNNRKGGEKIFFATMNKNSEPAVLVLGNISSKVSLLPPLSHVISNSHNLFKIYFRAGDWITCTHSASRIFLDNISIPTHVSLVWSKPINFIMLHSHIRSPNRLISFKDIMMMIAVISFVG